MRAEQTEAERQNTTTVTYMRGWDRERARERLAEMARINGLKTINLIAGVAREPVGKRILRLGSNLWPLADHPEFEGYDRSVARANLRRARHLACGAGVRLSFHPGQFCALASEDSGVVARTITCLEMHGEQAEAVGAGDINIHCWGRGGIGAFRANARHLSARVRSRLTVENDEFGVGLDALLAADLEFPVVLDPHHHWVNTGRWPDFSQVERAAATWPRERRPKMHWSWPRNDSGSEWPRLEGSRTAAREHHDTLPGTRLNSYYLEAAHRYGLDILVEAKHKDLARDLLYDQAVALGFM